MIPVTQTFVPPLKEYTAYLDRAFQNRWLTNRGELVLELESKLKTLINVPFLTLTTNGTLPIQIAIKSLELTGEIITTPFSYVATTSSIVWEGCVPVFVDIHPEYLTIDETQIEASITENTSAILATHVFGNPCAVNEIEKIAQKHNLKVIYDAAHCFGVTYNGKSIFNYGDVSTCSFHATKIFHTGEGGCMVTQDPEMHARLFRHHNFGHSSLISFDGIGINAKMSELQAAMGLAVLPYWQNIRENRERVNRTYRESLNAEKIQFLKIRENTETNYSYFPAIFETVEMRLKVSEFLEKQNIFSRRYFYPSLNQLPYITKKFQMPVSEQIADRILCLPCYNDLTNQQILMISEYINSCL